MLKNGYSKAPEEIREEERGIFFFHEDLDPKNVVKSKEDLDTMDRWTDPDETAGRNA